VSAGVFLKTNDEYKYRAQTATFPRQRESWPKRGLWWFWSLPLSISALFGVLC